METRRQVLDGKAGEDTMRGARQRTYIVERSTTSS